jgi:hypothetical protein
MAGVTATDGNWRVLEWCHEWPGPMRIGQEIIPKGNGSVRMRGQVSDGVETGHEEGLSILAGIRIGERRSVRGISEPSPTAPMGWRPLRV